MGGSLLRLTRVRGEVPENFGLDRRLVSSRKGSLVLHAVRVFFCFFLILNSVSAFLVFLVELLKVRSSTVLMPFQISATPFKLMCVCVRVCESLVLLFFSLLFSFWRTCCAPTPAQEKSYKKKKNRTARQQHVNQNTIC